MTTTELREQFEKETGKRWLVVPISHGETGYASHEYQLWLESKAKQYASQQAPEGMYTREQVEIDSILPKGCLPVLALLAIVGLVSIIYLIIKLF